MSCCQKSDLLRLARVARNRGLADVADELETLAAVRYADIEFQPQHHQRWHAYWRALTGGRGADPDALDICVLKLRDAKWLRGDPESFCTALQQFLFER